ncbi:cation transporter [Brevibacillus sp. NRS-1366]|uniref:cation transporter n=1 Tax=Brevibacillus sp. NRS-1366 TaxID=3233899 RepID=UPI003D1D17B4
MQPATIKVEGMSCRSCIGSIESAIRVIGVEGHVNFEQGTVQVQYNESEVELSNIHEAIRAKGYKVVE